MTMIADSLSCTDTQGGELVVYVQETKECPVVVDIMGIVLGVIGAMVAAD